MTPAKVPPNQLALVIEDDANLAEIFSKALESAGYTVEVLFDGRVALTRLSQVTPIAITLDLNLPNVSGRDLLSYIRQEPRFSKTRVILTTADALTANLLASQAELVLLKPISFSQLRLLASRLVSQS